MEKDTYFKCPNCGEQMCVEPMPEASTEHKDMGKPMPKKNAAKMPMDSLKSVIQNGMQNHKPEDQQGVGY